MYLIDLYQHTSPHKEYVSTNHYSYILNKFKNNENVSIIRSLSWDGLNMLAPDSLDYIYIDAEHSYISVKKDLEAAYRVIKSGGIIQLNDYTTFSPVEKMNYGVLHATNEFLEKTSANILGLSLDKNGYHDLAIKITK